MAVVVTPYEDVKAYFERKELGQSRAKKLLTGFDAYMAHVNKEEEPVVEKEYFTIGSMVDSILTGNIGDFERDYHVSEVEKIPSESMLKVVHYVYDEIQNSGIIELLPISEIELTELEDLILQGYDEYNVQPRWKDATKIANLIESSNEYFKDLLEGTGKTVVSKTLKEKIDKIVDSLRTNPRTARFFDRKMQSKMENYDFYYQLPIYFKEDGVARKALLDLVVVEKDEKGQILNIFPYDLKTMAGNNKFFLSTLKNRRYDIQAAWYTTALAHYFNFPEHEIKPFTFIVESTTFIGRPLTFECSQSLLTIGRQGRDSINIVDTNLFDIHEDTNKNIAVVPFIKGIKQILADYRYYQNQGWKEDKLIYTRGGHLKIDWEGFVYGDQG
jgi:hypothetical protein